MSGLEQTYYIIAIICMSLGLLLLGAIVAAIIIIRNKVIDLERMIKEKFHTAVNAADKAVEIAGAVRSVADAVGHKKK
ncbi:hypothetical protein CSA80_02700 [Candidatus Saccharibacteria bacterium]|nr:MAG: hypothetical protein CR973_02815 [Candidatus Saccharibacteria bacterium]PID99003.1 MAG: hypothetical protein CSA80_02700 [Candidatus Saccharibacteria bacterium]